MVDSSNESLDHCDEELDFGRRKYLPLQKYFKTISVTSDPGARHKGSKRLECLPKTKDGSSSMAFSSTAADNAWLCNWQYEMIAHFDIQ